MMIGGSLHRLSRVNFQMSGFRGFVSGLENFVLINTPIAMRIFQAIRDYRPESVTFWGVGFTNSDADLTEAYKRWCRSASKISLIHPSPTTEVADAEQILKRSIQHFCQQQTEKNLRRNNRVQLLVASKASTRIM